MTNLGRSDSGIWRALMVPPGVRRLVWGLVLGVAGPVAALPAVTAGDMPIGLLAVPVVAAVLVGRLWPGLVGAVTAFVLSAVYVSAPEGSYAPVAYDYVVLAIFVALVSLVALEEAARARARQVQERLAFLAEANRVLTTTLDVDRTLAELVALAVPRLADWCAILLKGSDDQIAMREVAHSDPEKTALARSLWERYPPRIDDPVSPVATVLRTGRPVLLPRIPEDLIERTARDQEHARILRELNLRSAIVVPIRGTHGPVGALVLVHAESDRRYDAGDAAFVEELAQTASIALENARLHRERSRIAHTLQNSLLPPEIPEIPGVEVAVRYRPAGEGNLVGGDFYDLFDVGEDSWAVALGDVCGKGPEAAAVTGLVRHTIRSQTGRRDKPSEVLSQVNRQILRENGGRFCTVTLGKVQRSNGHLDVTVSCGGHPAPLVVRPNRTVEAADCLGTLLGVFPEPELGDSPVRLGAGDSIVFYTDGVTEQFERAGQQGDARLVSLLWQCEGMDATAIADMLYREVALDVPVTPRDDIAIVVLRLPA